MTETASPNRDDGFAAWLAKTDYQLEFEFLDGDVPSMPEPPFSAEGLRAAEAELLRRYSDSPAAISARCPSTLLMRAAVAATRPASTACAPASAPPKVIRLRRNPPASIPAVHSSRLTSSCVTSSCACWMCPARSAHPSPRMRQFYATSSMC